MARNAETNLQNAAFNAVGQHDDVMIWRQQSGVFRSMTDKDRIVRVGVTGMSDSLMVVGVTITPDMIGKRIGVAVGVEFKTETGRQSDAQKRWQAAFEARGGVYRVVRSAAEITKLVENVKTGEAWK